MLLGRKRASGDWGEERRGYDGKQSHHRCRSQLAIAQSICCSAQAFRLNLILLLEWVYIFSSTWSCVQRQHSHGKWRTFLKKCEFFSSVISNKTTFSDRLVTWKHLLHYAFKHMNVYLKYTSYTYVRSSCLKSSSENWEGNVSWQWTGIDVVPKVFAFVSKVSWWWYFTGFTTIERWMEKN